MVLKCAAKKTLPGVTRAQPLAAAVLQGREAKQLAAGSVPRRLEELPDASERPASCRDQGSPLEPTGGVGREVASLEWSPRPSAGRPRKVSR